MDTGERNVFSALADEADVECDKQSKKYKTSVKSNSKNTDTERNGISDNHKEMSTALTERHAEESAPRRSSRSNKGVSREIFDPSHIPSPKHRLYPTNIGKSDSDNNSDNSRSRNDSSDSAKPVKKGNEVGLTKKVIKEETSSEDSESESDTHDPKKLWCICRKPHSGRFMISCDVCEEWFHGDCVGISVQRGKQMEKKGEEYVCPACLKNKEKKAKRSSETSKKDMKIKSGVKLKGYAYGETDTDSLAEKRKHKNDSKSPKAEGEPTVKQRKCIVSNCPNKAQSDSVYCSNVCILRHANESLSEIQKKSAKDKPPVRQESKEERILRKIKEAASRGKVAVMCMKTGKIFANASAPLKQDLEKFLKENTSFQKLRLPKAFKEKLASKEIKSTSSKPAKHVAAAKEPISTTKSVSVVKQSDDPDYKPKTEKQFSNPYKQFTPISPRNERGLDKAKKHKLHRQESAGDSKKIKHKSDSDRRHSLDKNTPAKVNAGKRDSRSHSDEKLSSKRDQAPSSEKEVRKNIQKTLQGILQQRSNNSEDLKMHPDSINKLVAKVEESLFKLFGGVNSKYKNRYRSIMFNLKDEKNEGLWRKVILGEVTSSRLVKMTAEEMASKELAQWRKHELTQELEMIHELEVSKQTMRPVAKITHKGEIAIDEDYSDLTESHLNTSAEKSTPTIAPHRIRRISTTQPDPVDPVTPTSSDTTSEHSNHLFDLNCMICTGQIKEEDANLEESHAVKRSTSIILSNEAQTPTEKETDEEIIKKIAAVSSKRDSDASVLGNTEKESEEPSSPYNQKNDSPSIISKPIGLEPPSSELKKQQPAWENLVWTGVISMPELSSFKTNAYVVSGNGKELVNIIPNKLVLDGRIHPKVVWEYLAKVRSFSNKEVCVIQFRASSEEDRVGYVSMLSYFSSRRRFGVVSNQNTQIIKDIYLAPLLETEDVPKYLLPFRGPGIPANHPSMLLGIVVRCIPEITRTPSKDFEARLAEITGRSRVRKVSDDAMNLDDTILRALSSSSNEEKAPGESPEEEIPKAKDDDEEEEYNPETAAFDNILDENETGAPADADEEAYDPEKVVFDDDDNNEASGSPEDDDAPYDPEDEAQRLESTEVIALQEKAARLEKMKQELEMKQAELAKEEMSLQNQAAPPPPPPPLSTMKPTKLVSKTLADPRMARLQSKTKATMQQTTAEDPLKKIFSVLNIDRPSPM